MANILPSKALNLDEQLSNLSLYKYHPSGILNVSLNRLKDMLDGKVEVIEPSNPFTYLLETSSLNTAFAIQEYTLLTRNLYPKLANNEKDLYLHMSDFDYLGRFSEPSVGNILINILYSDFVKYAYYDPIQEEYLFKIPRHFKISIDKYIFTLTTPIIIRKAKNNVIDIKYDNNLISDLFPISTNYIDFNIVSYNQAEKYLSFSIKLPEIDIEALELPIEKSKLFKNNITFNPKRKFYFMEAFYFKDNKWNKFIVTHTDEVYNIRVPTICLKVFQNENNIEYFIPPIYINTDMLGSKVKFLLYTTNGNVDINFSDFKVADFNNEYNSIFPDQDLDNLTSSLHLISKVIFIRDRVSGGKNNLTFDELKSSVIDNSIGDRKLPITDKQINFLIGQNNFKLIKEIDTITNRIFNLEINIPNALTRYPISKIDLDMIEYKTRISDLRASGVVIGIADNITIIPENTIFKLDQNNLTILSSLEVNALKALSGTSLTTEVNKFNYLSTFYHYILDTNNNLTNLRAYDLSVCKVKTINFKYFNSTCKIGINTISSQLLKVDTGYMLSIISNVKKYIDSIAHNNVTPYLVYQIGNSKFYLRGELYTVTNNQPVYRFFLNTNYYIDSDNNIFIDNFKDANENIMSINFNLNSILNLIYVSNVIPNTFVASELENFIYGSYLAVGNCVVTHEEFNIITGVDLKYLYKPIHTSTDTYAYETHTVDVPLTYLHNVYDNTNTLIHNKDDIVYDELNNIVYKNRIGDIKLDLNEHPIPISTLELNRYFNLLFVSYNLSICTKQLLIDYKNYVKEYLTTNIIDNVASLQKELLENTEAYVVVPKKLDNVNIKVNGNRIVNINSLQSFVIDVYVNKSVYNDLDIRDNISYIILKEIDNYLSYNIILIKTELLSLMHSKLKEFVKNISISKFTELNAEYIEIINTNARISMSKSLINEADGYNLRENVLVTFIQLE